LRIDQISHPPQSSLKGGGQFFCPIDILDYIYAVLHSPSYREQYKEFLKMNKYEKDRKYDFCGECSDEHHLDTTIVSIDSKII
jgi:hypothetical protein